jgi:hypothetical protein
LVEVLGGAANGSLPFAVMTALPVGQELVVDDLLPNKAYYFRLRTHPVGSGLAKLIGGLFGRVPIPSSN